MPERHDHATWHALFDGVPMMCDVVDGSGCLVTVNRRQAEALGYAAGALDGRPLDEVYAADAAEHLMRQLEDAAAGDLGMDEGVALQLRCRNRELIDVYANIARERAADGEALLRIAKMRPGEEIGKARRAVRENTVLRGIVGTARDACWCIEYAEPLDLTAPEPEILRQFFENVSYWRLCNEAMAKLYKLPADLDFNEQSVRFYFPHSPANEEFVKNLIAADFNLNDALSIDQRHDGTAMYVENDVRALIRDGKLHRLWGTARDVSGYKRKERELTRQVDDMIGVLSAVPDPILVLDADGLLEAANPALAMAFGWSIDAALGTSIDDMITFEGGFGEVAAKLAAGPDTLALTAPVADASGARRACAVHVARLAEDGAAPRYVATLRGHDAKLAVAGGA
jgi:PAS domain S-box-containing protein